MRTSNIRIGNQFVRSYLDRFGIIMYNITGRARATTVIYIYTYYVTCGASFLPQWREKSNLAERLQTVRYPFAYDVSLTRFFARIITCHRYEVYTPTRLFYASLYTHWHRKYETTDFNVYAFVPPILDTGVFVICTTSPPVLWVR